MYDIGAGVGVCVCAGYKSVLFWMKWLQIIIHINLMATTQGSIQRIQICIPVHPLLNQHIQQDRQVHDI